MGDAPFAPLLPLKPLMEACVHCGFCLPSCPSYVLLGQEMASPRGRIHTMRAGIEQRVTFGPAVVQHFDTCLGCMACETACPSGVKYAPLVEEARASFEHHFRRSAKERWFRALIFAVLPYPGRLRALTLPLVLARAVCRVPAVSALLPAMVRNMLALAPAVTFARARVETAELTPASGTTRLRVGLLTGCVQRAFFGNVNQATARVLSAEGCEVHAPRSQGCCGALALHAGDDHLARRLARELIQEFEHLPVDIIAVNAAGCGSSMKEYGRLLRDDPKWSGRARAFAAKVRDVTEVLASLNPPRATRHPLALRVAYHDACHLAHAQGIRREPRSVLASIPGIALVPVAEGDLCCGSAGIFNLVQPEMADTLGRRKAAHLADVSPDVVVTSNPGCILQIQASGERAGRPLKVLHIVELLDAAMRGEGIRGPSRQDGTMGP